MHKGGKDITGHSKVVSVDDQLALVGIHNMCQPSIANIAELHLGMVDARNELVHDMRLVLKAEHIE